MLSPILLLGLCAGTASAIPFEHQQQQPLGIDPEVPAAQPLTQTSPPKVHGRFLHITGMLSDMSLSHDLQR